MRINYSEDEGFPGQFELWQANCRRSISGKQGQQELIQMREALLALPEKRLIHGLLANEQGEVCAIGAYARHKGIDISKFDPEDYSDEVGIEAGMPQMVAWTVVAQNDMDFDHMTPEARYEATLRWLDRVIETDAASNG
jgi:hypothetical protein